VKGGSQRSASGVGVESGCENTRGCAGGCGLQLTERSDAYALGRPCPLGRRRALLGECGRYRTTFSTHADEKPRGVTGASSLRRRTQRTRIRRNTLRSRRAENASQSGEMATSSTSAERRTKPTNDEKGCPGREAEASLSGGRVRFGTLGARGILRRAEHVGESPQPRGGGGENGMNPRVGVGDGQPSPSPGKVRTAEVVKTARAAELAAWLLSDEGSRWQHRVPGTIPTDKRRRGDL